MPLLPNPSLFPNHSRDPPIIIISIIVLFICIAFAAAASEAACLLQEDPLPNLEEALDVVDASVLLHPRSFRVLDLLYLDDSLAVGRICR